MAVNTYDVVWPSITSAWRTERKAVSMGAADASHSPIGYPKAKSLLWVANIEKIPALLKRLSGLATIRVRTQTMKNTHTLAMRMLQRKGQMTFPKSNNTMFLNKSAGRANLDTKFPSPLAWVGVMMFILPATYPHKMMPKHSRRAGRSLSIDMVVVEEDGESSISVKGRSKVLVLAGVSITAVSAVRAGLWSSCAACHSSSAGHWRRKEPLIKPKTNSDFLHSIMFLITVLQLLPDSLWGINYTLL